MKCEKHGAYSKFCKSCDFDVMVRLQKKEGMVLVSEDALESIKRMAEQDAKDAARYRFLRQYNDYLWMAYCKNAVSLNEFDAAIDAAMQAK